MSYPLKEICALHNFYYKSSRPVSGGDINSAYALETNEGSFFIKLNSADLFPHMFHQEAAGLMALKQGSTILKVPNVVAIGEYDQHQYLLQEWLEKASPGAGFWKTFAAGLAQLHRQSHTHFGWQTQNYIGSLIQRNNATSSWEEFYAEHRILPLVEQLVNASSFSKADANAAVKLCSRLKDVFPKEAPALLHGDLWAGNFMAARSTEAPQNEIVVKPCIYDPAVYFGHREMDIGMSLLFGGFDKTFYDAYNEDYPLEKGWRSRISLTQLYPLLVHAILFGGGYIGQCREILKSWS